MRKADGQASVDAAQVRNAVLRLCLAGHKTDADQAAFELLREAMEQALGGALFIPHPALLVRGLRAIGLSLPTALQRRLEAIGLREEKRSSIAAAQADQLERVLRREGIDPHPLRGWHCARLYYPEPLARHCHALRWLVPSDAERERLASLFAAEGWDTLLPSPLQTPHKIILAGRDRISVELHSRVFPWTDRLPDSNVQSSPEFMAVETMGSAIVEPHARAGLWLVDLVQLLRNERLDATRFAATAQDYGIAATTHHALGRIAELTGPAEAAVHEKIRHLRTALTVNKHPRDARAVSDLLLVQAMANASRAGLLLKAMRRPDLLARGHALRRDGARRRRQAVKSRQALRSHHASNRQ
jgi:hypothetical protein